jgi:hypothetical protein
MQFCAAALPRVVHESPANAFGLRRLAAVTEVLQTLVL